MSRKWSWDPKAARKTNGCANPVDREGAVRDSDGRTVPEWKRRAVLPPDLRWDAPIKALPPEKMWAGYFAGPQNLERFARLEEAVVQGKCVALGSCAGVYAVEQILAQVYGHA